MVLIVDIDTTYLTTTTMNPSRSKEFIHFNFLAIANFDYVLWEEACICKPQDNLNKDVKLINGKINKHES